MPDAQMSTGAEVVSAFMAAQKLQQQLPLPEGEGRGEG